MIRLIVVLVFVASMSFADNGKRPCAPYFKACHEKGLHFGDGKMVKCMHDGAEDAKDQACLDSMKAHAEQWKEKHGKGGDEKSGD